MPKEKVLVLYSAGVDSTVAAYFFASRGYDVTLAIFDDGAINKPGDPFYNPNKTIDVGNLAEEFYFYAEYHKNFVNNNPEFVNWGKIDWVELRYPQLNAICATHTKPVNKESAEAESLGLDFWVGFKMLMGMIAQSYGAANNYKLVATGHMGYNSHYKDEDPDAFKMLTNLMSFCYGERVYIPEIVHPWMSPDYDTKEKVIELGMHLGVPLDYTYTCRRGDKLTDGRYSHCGTCENCMERSRAFSELGTKDPAP